MSENVFSAIVALVCIENSYKCNSRYAWKVYWDVFMIKPKKNKTNISLRYIQARTGFDILFL